MGEPRTSRSRREQPVDFLCAAANVSDHFRSTLLWQEKMSGMVIVDIKEDVIPLSDGAGEVVAVGKGVTRVKPGPSIAEYLHTSVGFSIDGMLAEYAVFYEDAIVRIPAYLSYVEAASLPCAAVTAWVGLNKIEPLQPGHTVLIQGTGGILGARVLAITSSDKKAAKLKELGADAVELLALTDGKGVDRVLDIAGEKTTVKSGASTKIGGVVVVVGFASGFGGGLPPIDILSQSLTVTGSSIGSRLDFEAMLAAMVTRETRPAYRRLESGQQVGKVVIEVAQTAD
ncbi:hypothetical protein BDV12DRAFT_205593 [Aspergillus spectabilis]